MLCDVCKNQEANVFFTQIINGQVQKVNLCEECSKQKGVTDPTGFALAELLLGLGETKTAPGIAKPAEPACPICGFTQSKFKQIGRLGCPECYDFFRQDVEGVLGNIHKGTRHTGKVPAHAAAHSVTNRLETLRRELARAIDDENYEDASRLRDEINLLSPSAASPSSSKKNA